MKPFTILLLGLTFGCDMAGGASAAGTIPWFATCVNSVRVEGIAAECLEARGQADSACKRAGSTVLSFSASGCDAWPMPSGWYGFAGVSNLDQEDNLRRKCTGGQDFSRLSVDGSFNDLCKKIERKCKRVCDWEGNTKPCSENPQDGTRVALCE